MADTGLVNLVAFLGVQGDGGMDDNWGTPDNAQIADGAFAQSFLRSFEPTFELRGSQLAGGPLVPAGATILGVVATNLRQGPSNLQATDHNIQMLGGGGPAGDNKKDLTPWPAAGGLISYGGPTDLWNNVLTAAIVNASDFGFLVQAVRTESLNTLCQIDQMQMQVFYELPSAVSIFPKVI